MSLNLGTYKTMGVIYEVAPTEFTAKGYPKRFILLEIPLTTGMDQKTTVIKFVTLGDECASLDYYNEGDFVELMFKLDGFFWNKPETADEEAKKIHLQSLKIVDIQKRSNPFETKEAIDDSPDALSPDVVSELASNVKDYANEPAQQDTLFDKDGNLGDIYNFNKDDNDPLPF